MKRAVVILAAGALIFGSALSAMAQQAPTVSFSGEFRFVGFVSNNMTDYKDTEPDGKGGSAFKDSRSQYTQRLRIWTTVESADKKAKAVWGLEVGDITLGSGGGASGGEFGGTTSRTGNNSGGEFGADGVAVETKHLYIWFEVPGVPNASLTVGIQNFTVLAQPTEFFSDDAAGIKLDLKFDPVDLQLFTAKLLEGVTANPDDVDVYGARLGINVAKDLRLTLEGAVFNTQNLAGTDFGDTFFVGGTVAAKFGTMGLDGGIVYGQRTKACAVCAKGTAEESGWGVNVALTVPVDPIRVTVQGWYMTGDSTVTPETSGFAALAKDSDRLPVFDTNGSWYTRPLIAEAFAGHQAIGGPGGAPSPYYAQLTGTYGIGGSAMYSLNPSVTLGAGVAYVGATDAKGLFGDNVFEVDAGLFYMINANLGLQTIASYLIPDKGDNAWALAYRLRYAF